ncbi:Gfo/Idh/MocA family oxidoreductase [Paraflavisolibacter sp. H34]|uniref:Gfo/Idh/MocA family protein n=1 Tax=Huijunlia imazamoxiresistens TaxID=3127457 RepID=UPI0030189357
MNRKLKIGMIGGGPGAFIGAVHRIAAQMDGEIELAAGAFSSNPEKSRQAGEALHLPAHRVYASYDELIAREKGLPEGERIDAVSIVTPNHLHFDPAKKALEAGFHVVLDKPMTFDLAQAHELQEIATQSGRLFCLTHTYTGYPMVKEARYQVQAGNLGTIRKVVVAYPQGWLSTFLEGAENKQAEWRTDPARSGQAGCMGDIGTHAFNLAEYVTGLKVTRLCADIHTVVEGRLLDDDGAVLLKFDNGASGLLYASQVMAGEENDVTIKVYGEKGGLEWKQTDCNTLLLKWSGRPTEIYRTGSPYLSSFAAHNTRVPAGHPEGYLEAFANHYRNFALSVRAAAQNETPRKEWLDFPGLEDGIRGMAFIENVIRSGRSTEKWTEFTL